MGVVLSFVFVFNAIGEANSFPFRTVHVGDQLPATKVKSLRDQQGIDLAQLKGQPLMVVFVGADIPTKKERSVKALTAVQKLAGFAEEKGVKGLVVDAQGDSAEVINELISEAALSLPVYIDDERQAYGNLGIFVMPSILLISADGTVAAGMGYSRDLPKRLKGEMEIMLGEKTRAQVEEELRPEMVEKSEEEKGAKRHYHLGMTMIERGQPEIAIREMKKALSLEPGMGKAQVHLGCLLLDEGKTEEAKSFLDKGLELEPDMVEGQICLARIKAEAGNLDGAIDDITFMMLRNSRSNALHFVYGTMLEKKGDSAQAMQEYRKAYELLEKKSHEK